ncbi:MAG: hypothetical protein ACOCU3_00590 [bacterium]
MDPDNNQKVDTARKLVDDFLDRTGVTDRGGDVNRRYLWTDSFAVQSCFALNHLSENNEYYRHALKLIDQVHFTLGRHRPVDVRTGWISELSEDEGRDHPVRNGLRIGKKFPERPESEDYDPGTEWDRDGQYFHYLTRWFNTLVQAFIESGERKYAHQAVELIKAGGKFIRKDGGRIWMVWKMNVDLTEPVVETMGAHDPLEGFLCVLTAMNLEPDSRHELEPLRRDMEALCRGMNWFTDDPLGIGGLLLNTVRSSELSRQNDILPSNIRPSSLFAAGLDGLQIFSDNIYDHLKAPEYRLAFRECGLTLGFRVLYGLRERLSAFKLNLDRLSHYLALADEIENFWNKDRSRQSLTWTDHQDINAVTLASSILARYHPQAFSSGISIDSEDQDSVKDTK